MNIPPPAPSPVPNGSGFPNISEGPFSFDLRFGVVSIPANNGQGYDPAGDALALMAPSVPSPATQAIQGTQTLGSLGGTNRFVIRIPAQNQWNGKLVVCGTPSFRSEFASDLIWGDYLLSLGYAYAASNKGVPYNTVVETASAVNQQAYPIPFNAAGLEAGNFVFRFGALTPNKIPINTWNDDFANLTRAAKYYLYKWRGSAPSKTYAVGLSNGGAQVRSLLEQHPDLVDGGVDWAGVYWSSQFSFLNYMPVFINAMNAYVASNYTDQAAYARILAAGYPADRLQPGNAAHPSLWSDYYSNALPFYSDLTVFAYAALIDPAVQTGFSTPGPVCTPSTTLPNVLPGNCKAVGISLPQNRATYGPSAAAQSAIAAFAHTGAVSRPLVSIAGSADMFITPANNLNRYLNAVRQNGSAPYYQYLVDGGTHVDTFAAFGYKLQPQAPFAWSAFNQMVAIVEKGFNPPGQGTAQLVASPSQIVAS